MATEFSFDFNAALLKEGPKVLDNKLQKAMLATVKYHATGAERHMKHNAPWKDRTTNARNGLFAMGRKLSKGLYALILGHSVTYGIYLELGHDQKTKRGIKRVKARPIIIPTLTEYGPKVMKTFNKILDRI